jgi:hypothetical protein
MLAKKKKKYVAIFNASKSVGKLMSPLCWWGLNRCTLWEDNLVVPVKMKQRGKFEMKMIYKLQKEKYLTPKLMRYCNRQMVFLKDLGPCVPNGRIQAKHVDGLRWSSFIEGRRVARSAR